MAGEVIDMFAAQSQEILCCDCCELATKFELIRVGGGEVFVVCIICGARMYDVRVVFLPEGRDPRSS